MTAPWCWSNLEAIPKLSKVYRSTVKLEAVSLGCQQVPAELVDVMVGLDILQLVADGDGHVGPALVERPYRFVA